MFTGIVEAIGTVKRLIAGGSHPVIAISSQFSSSELSIGSSIAVNGVCLTVRVYEKNAFEANVSRETLRATALEDLRIGSQVNLERAMSAQSRFDGHIVQGHVDYIGAIKSIIKGTADWVVTISFPKPMAPYIVEKGSITVDGVSLTATDVTQTTFSVHIIPHTWENTILNHYRVSQRVNLETDIIGRYVVQHLLRLPARLS